MYLIDTDLKYICMLAFLKDCWGYILLLTACITADQCTQWYNVAADVVVCTAVPYTCICLSVINCAIDNWKYSLKVPCFAIGWIIVNYIIDVAL